MNAKHNEFLGADEEAFGPSFFDKQKTWKCGMGYAMAQIVLAVVVWVLISVQKSHDWNVKLEKR